MIQPEGRFPAESDEEAVDASAVPYRMAAAEMSAAIFVGTSARRCRKIR